MPKDQVFISYSHRDKKWRIELETHLKPYLRNGTISSWSEQPGDPAKAAKVILKIAELSEPPLRLLLGSDAVFFARAAAEQRMAEDEKWKELILSTDFAWHSKRGRAPWIPSEIIDRTDTLVLPRGLRRTAYNRQVDRHTRRCRHSLPAATPAPSTTRDTCVELGGSDLFKVDCVVPVIAEVISVANLCSAPGQDYGERNFRQEDNLRGAVRLEHKA